MQLTPTVSVILPFHKDEATLQAAIDSILGQTFQDFELLLVSNNASTACLEIVAGSRRKDTRIKLLQESKPGPAHATWRGFQEAKAPYISRMDADDICHPEKLAKQMGCFDQHPQTDVVSCQVDIFASHSRPLTGFQYFADWHNHLLDHQQILLNRFVEIPMVNPTLVFRRSVAERHGLYRDGDFPEDYEMQLRWLTAGIQCAKIPEKLLKWRDRPERLTRTDQRYRQDAFYQTKAKYLAEWLTNRGEKRPIAIWGAGRVSRKRAAFLEEAGIPISCYIDIIHQKTQVKNCIHFSELPAPSEIFVISYVARRGAGDKINDFLIKKGFVEGRDFLMAA